MSTKDSEADVDSDSHAELADELAEDDDTDTSSGSNKLVRRKIKVRQHVNPLRIQYQQPVPLSNEWIIETFQTPTNPFIIDVGCSKGSWALTLCQECPELNILGLEIRRPIVDFALSRKNQRCLRNVHFLGKR